MTRIGFVGLGVMGTGMVANLLKQGYPVTVWNRTASRTARPASLGATVADSLADLVGSVDVVMYCLADDAAVSDVALGNDGISSLVRQGQTVVDLSTVSPETTALESAAYAKRGATFVDAPVFGSRNEANAGRLWVVVGGDEDAVARVRPLLSAISETVHHLGPIGSGVRMKLVGNLVVAAQLQALGEALSLAKKAGLPLQTVLDVFAVTDFRSPIFDGVGAAVLAGDYSPHFALALMRKDARLVRDFAATLGVSITASDATRHTIERAVENGWGAENASALIKVLAGDAGVNLATPSV